MKIDTVRTVGLALAVSMAVLASLTACSNGTTAVDAQPAVQTIGSLKRATLFKDARGELALARAQGKRDVLMIVAAADRTAAALAERVRRSGGLVRFMDEDVDYLRVRMPIDAVDRLLDDQDVVSAELSIDAPMRVYDLVNGRAGLGLGQARDRVQAATERAATPAGKLHEPSCVDPDLPLTRPHSPLADLGGTGFRTEHPSFDGRGVTIALLDGHPDLLLPELQEALTLDGRVVRKVTDVLTVTDPEDDPVGGRSWIRTDAVDATGDGKFVYRDATYVAPRLGAFRVGFFDETRLGSAVAGDINRDGNPDGSSRVFAVLWATDTNDVWVDVNQNQRFDDEPALTDYRVRGDVGVFGKDDPATPERESIAFTVQTRPGTEWVAIHPAYDKHGTNVIGAAVASRGSDGRFEGIAPGARLVSIHHGPAGYAHAEALIRAVKDPLVDIVVLEQHSAVDDSYVLRDGRLVVTLVLERLIHKFRKPVLLPASNMPALSAVTEIGQARGAIAVGGHQSRTSFRVNRGLSVEHEDNLHVASSFGPAGDGGLKPDVLAPSDVLSTTIGYMPARSFGAGGCRRLPPGYTISNGTSTAAPVAAGAVALLISAAKQSGTRYDAARIKRALTMSARFLANIPAHMQGNGLLDVAAAWQLLQALDGESLPPQIESRAPVHTTFGHLLPVPQEGSGLFEIGPWRAGEVRERSITLTRTSGPSRPQRYELTLQGNDGTYRVPGSVVLPLGTPVAVPVRIAPTSAGVHSALLTLDHPSTPGHAHRVLLTVVAADALAVDNNYTFSGTLHLRQGDGGSNRYVHIPENASELVIELKVGGGDAVINVKTPDGRYRGWASWVRTGDRIERFAIQAPQAGVWEIMVRPGPGTTNAAVPAQGPESSTAAELLVTARIGQRQSISAETERTIAQHEQHVYTLDVPPGTGKLHARLDAASGEPSSTDLDLYAFDCTSGECVPAQSDARVGNDEVMEIPEPAAGRWRIVVDGFRVSGDGARYGLRVSPEPSRANGTSPTAGQTTPPR